MAPYGRLLIAPAEGWWPLATWRALRALWISVKNKYRQFLKKIWGIFFTPTTTAPPLPLAQSIFFTPIFFIGGHPYTPPPPEAAPLPLAQFFFFFFFFFFFGGGGEGILLM